MKRLIDVVPIDMFQHPSSYMLALHQFDGKDHPDSLPSVVIQSMHLRYKWS